ncbi:PREDICTED: cirhin [Papilio polytes]|uniref:cirhin n=1 Tax=Papilio polytes TaxID=76194 RepID=UPI000676B152|nr:PREDICTED: cirhin [Papilio polytes]
MACKLHRVRYYNPKPEPINCVSFNKANKTLAVARSDASIEIWDLNYAPYLVKLIPGAENASVEALGWVNDRLLSTGLGGALLEWDVNTLSVKNTVILTGYAAWCLDVDPNNTLIAVGTEQGYINLYSVEYDDIVYKKLFDKQEGRIMCCKFDKTGKVLVTGSINTIRVWNVETGHATCRISVSRRGNEMIVWCLAVLSDNVVVSGDSQGRLTFWDSVLGDQIESYTTHKSNILSIVVSDDEKNLYCSGVDPVIMNFVKVSKGSGKITGAQWVKNVQRNIHEHQVRALVLNGDKLISVGADGYLTLSSYPPKWVMRIPPMIPAVRSAVSGKNKLLLLRYSNHLEVWKLGTYGTNENGNVIITDVQSQQNVDKENDNTHLEQDTAILDYKKGNKSSGTQKLKITDKPVKLISVKSKKNKQIVSCALSPDGQFVAYSTDSDVRMLKLETEDESNISLTKMLISGLSSMCDRMVFSEDSQTLLVHSRGELKVLHVDAQAGATVVQIIPTDKYLKSKTALHLHVCEKTRSNVRYVVLSDSAGGVAVWRAGCAAGGAARARKYDHHATLPAYRCVPAALTVDTANETLIIAYVDQKLVEYDLLNKKFSEWGSAAQSALPAQWAARRTAVASVCAHPAADKLVFQDETSLWIMNKKPTNNNEEPSVKKKFNKNDSSMNLKIIPIKYLAGFHWIGDDEAVTLEILPENIVSQLPPAFVTKRHNMG